ncbi:MAG: TRAP transporter small permease subunit, partial [Bacteroidia bacterium]|nr:TRAP transporter small permease subunit [Bacteroidia bacterium]
MKKTIHFIDEHFEETLLVIMLVLITLVEFLQVVIRNIPWIPALKWAEEFCRFCWIWSVFLSLPYTIKKASMLRVSVLLDAFSEKVRNTMNIAVDLINACIMAL